MIRAAGATNHTILVVNKLDGGKESDQSLLAEWYGLGFPELVGTSARQ
ncbi:MAG: hypothetical protein H6765_08635 [Candidatus Peribacteria bacterium]|nr:MAG: hypothetical protein H6765_08635 [Candidatus Peribacteria bacterium]